MSKPLKWILALLAAAVVLVIAVVIIASMVIDAEQIQAQISKATGRTFTMGGDSKMSFFPWVGVTLTDVHLGNPSGFGEKDMVAVDFFEVRVKVVPLFSGNIEVKRFVLNNADIKVIRDKKGRFNYEFTPSGQVTEGKQPAKPSAPSSDKEGALPIKALKVEEFVIHDGSLTWIDMMAGTRQQIQQINLTLENVSLDRPVQLSFSAVVDHHSVALTGDIGPVGPSPGKGPIAFNLALAAGKAIQTKLNGQVDPSGPTPKFDLSLDIAPFAVSGLLSELGQAMPLEPADNGVLKKIALKLNVSGSPEAVSVQNGLLTLDESQIRFSAKAREFAKPDLVFSADLDRIDLDRYLPAPTETTAAEKTAPPQKAAAPIDYAPLRKLVMDGRIKIGELKVKNVRTQNIDIHVTAKNGILRADPIRMDLYTGKVQIDGTFNFQGQTPSNTVNLAVDKLQAGPLLKDFLNKDLIEGVLNTTIKLNFSGDQPDRIRQTLSGGGDLRFNDGAIVGIDLANMVRNVKSAFGGEKLSEKPRTDFSEFLVPLEIKNGLARIDGTRLNSPLMRVLGSGNAHLAEETLNLRIEPKFVATLVGQGDTAGDRSGLMVPVLVTGTFTKPKFAPDLKGMLSTSVPGKEKITQEVETTKKKITEDIEKKTQELFKNLPFGGSKN